MTSAFREVLIQSYQWLGRDFGCHFGMTHSRTLPILALICKSTSLLKHMYCGDQGHRSHQQRLKYGVADKEATAGIWVQCASTAWSALSVDLYEGCRRHLMPCLCKCR